MMRCPNCQVDVIIGAAFCNHCGVRIPKLCNNCYTSNPAESKFCCSCGGSLSSASEPPAPEPPASSVTAPRGQDMPQDGITTCPRCRKVNEPGSTYCFSCGLPLEQASPAQIKRRNSSITESPIHWYIKALKKYAVFNGRARRKEFWYFLLFDSIFEIAFIVADVVVADLTMEPVSSWAIEYGLGFLYVWATFIPFLAVSVRRLHDIDRSGWWALWGVSSLPFVFWADVIGLEEEEMFPSAIGPALGFIVLLVWAAQDSSPGENRFGPNPKDTT